VTSTKANQENDLAKELAAQLADSEAERDKLQDEIDRMRKTVEGFMTENEALKAELGGNRADPGKANIGNGEKTSPTQKGRRAERLARALLEAAQKRGNHG
jgi:regulator of replication initiation timing